VSAITLATAAAAAAVPAASLLRGVSDGENKLLSVWTFCSVTWKA